MHLINRKTFLSTVAMAGMSLPWMEAMGVARKATNGRIKRMLCVVSPFGVSPTFWHPKGEGVNYQPSKELKILDQFRSEYTVFSNLDHGEYGRGGHSGVHTFLSGVNKEDATSLPEANITLDQKAVMHLGSYTRFPSLNLGGGQGSVMNTWTKNGIWVRPETNIAKAYRNLFHNDSAKDLFKQSKEMDLDLKILSINYQQAKSFKSKLGRVDQQKLEEYFDDAHDLARKIENNKKWVNKDKPGTEMKSPMESDFVKDLPLFYDLILEAFKSDSSRFITLEKPKSLNLDAIGVDAGSYHGVSHHGQKPGGIEKMAKVDSFFLKEMTRFLDKMKSTKDPLQDGSLLDNTVALFGSGMGNSSSHSNKDCPVLLLGGGLKHQTHFVGPVENRERLPLHDLWLTVLQHIGCPIDRYNRSTSSLTGFGAA